MQDQGSTLVVIMASALFGVLIVAFISTFLFITRKRNYMYKENLTRIKREYDNAILNSQIEVQANTLQEVSEELHDNIGQLLSSTIMLVQVLSEKGNAALQKDIEATRSMVLEVKDQVRHISRSISPRHI